MCALGFVLCAAAEAAVERQTVVVREALTGDTVRLAGGKTLRYTGLAAPPRQSLLPLLREYGEASYEFNSKLVTGQTVAIEWDSQIRDERNNLLGYVYLQDGTFLNELILRQGHARANPKAPNLRFTGTFRRAELEARRGKLGLWKEEPDNPYLKSEYLGEKSTKIFYYPTSPELDRIPKANLETFRSRVEAIAAGYKPCSTCREDMPVEYS